MGIGRLFNVKLNNKNWSIDVYYDSDELQAESTRKYNKKDKAQTCEGIFYITNTRA